MSIPCIGSTWTGMIFPCCNSQKELMMLKIKKTERDMCCQVQKKQREIWPSYREEEECGICLEISSKFVLPNCNHSLGLKYYRNWRAHSPSCPFCRDCLKIVNSGGL